MKKAHLLQISLEKDVTNPNFLQRQTKYARDLRKNTIVAFTNKNQNQQPYQKGKVFIWPTASATKIAYIPDAIKKIIAIHRQDPIDCLTSQDPFATAFVGVILKRTLKIPLVIQSHTPSITSANWRHQSLTHRISVPAISTILKEADAIRVVSQGLITPFTKLAPQAIVRAIPIPLQMTHFIVPTIKPPVTRLITVSRLSPEKNILTLIQAIHLLASAFPQLTLTIVGDGPEKRKLINYVLQNNLQSHIKLAGPKTHMKVQTLLADHQLYVSPSLYEGWGRAIAEAMAARLPVATTPIESIGHLVLPGITASVAKGFTATDIAQAIRPLLVDTKKANKFAQAGYQHAQKLAHQHSYQAFTDLIYDTVKT